MKSTSKKKSLQFKTVTITVLLSSLFIIDPGYAAGFGFEYQSVRASARGNAFVASNSSSALIHYNPGGLPFLKQPEYQSNTFAIFGDLTFEQNGTEYNTSDGVAITGSSYYAHPFEYRGRSHAFGIGLTTPYGQGITWDNNTPFRTDGFAADQKYIQLHLAAATEITKGLGFGAELLVAYSELETRSGVLVPDDEFKFKGDDFAFGYQLGIHYSPNDRWRFGLNCRSNMELNHEGDARFRVPSSLPSSFNVDATGRFSFDLPQHVTFGFEYDVTRDLTIAAQAQWTSWSDVEGFEFRSSVPAFDDDIIVNWKNSWIYSIGASYNLNKKTTLHGGYMYVESLIDDTTRTPLVSDFIQQFFSVGVTHERGKWVYDASLIYVYSKDENVSGSVFGTDGTFENSGGFINLGLTRKF